MTLYNVPIDFLLSIRDHQVAEFANYLSTQVATNLLDLVPNFVTKVSKHKKFQGMVDESILRRARKFFANRPDNRLGGLTIGR